MNENDSIHSNKWMYTVRIIVTLVGIIQAGITIWAKYITSEVIDNRNALTSVQVQLQGIKENVNYIRDRIDRIQGK